MTNAIKGIEGHYPKFEFMPSSHGQIADTVNKHGEFLVMNISIATNFPSIGEAQIDIRDFIIEKN